MIKKDSIDFDFCCFDGKVGTCSVVKLFRNALPGKMMLVNLDFRQMLSGQEEGWIEFLQNKTKKTGLDMLS